MKILNPRFYRSVNIAAAASLTFTFSLTAASAVASPMTEQSGQSGAISSEALRAAVTDDATRGFYQQNGWQPVWSPAAAQALKQALADRSAHGLDRISFLKDFGASASAAQQEVALTMAALHYASALALGNVDPESLHQVYTLPRAPGDLAEPLAKAIAQDTLADWLASLAPQDQGYVKLSEAYRAAVKALQSGSDSNPQIAASGLIHVGDTDDRVPEIVQQLQTSEYLSSNQASSETATRYTQPIADALKRLQRDYGIADDGVVGPDTVAVLNLDPADRARAIAVALERLRWLGRNPPATRIDVNIASARLRYYRDGKLVDSRKVIVGKPGKETPMLMAPIYRLVANPTWTIPKSIENSELSNVGPSYLADHNMVRRNGYIVQQPGPNNALGLVKFDMQDDEAIYLHDTGSPSLFDRSQRHLSHGCIRVENALGFAEMIANDEGIADKWKAARAGSDQQFIDLPNQIPVRLLYGNAYVEDQGQVIVGTDPYGWNGPIAKKLGFGEGAHAQAKAEKNDVGP